MGKRCSEDTATNPLIDQMGFTVETSSVGVGEDDVVVSQHCGRVGTFGEAKLGVVVVGPRKIERDDGPGPEAFGVLVGFVGKSSSQAAGGGDGMDRVVDVGVVIAAPVSVPAGFDDTFWAPFADL